MHARGSRSAAGIRAFAALRLVRRSEQRGAVGGVELEVARFEKGHVLRRRQSRLFFELHGEILQTVVVEILADLAERHIVFGHQLLGLVDAHAVEVGDDRLTGRLLEQRAGPGDAVPHIGGDLFEFELFADVFFHVVDHAVDDRFFRRIGGRQRPYGHGLAGIPADQIDEQQFEQVFHDLSAGKLGCGHLGRNIVFAGQTRHALFRDGQNIVAVGGGNGNRLLRDLVQPLAVAGKTDEEHIARYVVGAYLVRLVGRVQKDLPLRDDLFVFGGFDDDFAAVGINQFPGVMAFALIREFGRIEVRVRRIQRVDGKKYIRNGRFESNQFIHSFIIAYSDFCVKESAI